MKRSTVGTALFGIVTMGSLTLTGTAAAAPLGGSSANDVVNQLHAQGYDVQLNLNGARDVPLSECIVTGVHGLPNPTPSGAQPNTQFTSVYVDVVCPSND